ncbi:sensor histidine kinase [Azonexus sp.]|uniref:sensor histidine kinase n=1 Tax=Azonexus sp. TaxID=1872668 RepID=UPI0039E6137A
MSPLPHPARAPINRQRLSWYLLLPKLGLALLIAALIALLWLLQKSEREEQHNVLIKDVLWLEQSLRFHLENHREQLQQLAGELAEETQHQEQSTLFQLRASHFLKNNPDILRLGWLDAQEKNILTLPIHLQRPADSPQAQILSTAFDTARRLGKAVYSAPYLNTAQDGQIHLLLPIYHSGELSGMLQATYRLNLLLSKQIPWWFTEKYKVEIVDDNEQIFASKTQVAGTSSDSYLLAFDPPGQGLRLKISSYPSTQNPLQNMLTLAILFLALGVFASLWLVRGLMQKSTRAEAALRAEHAFRTAMENSLTVGMRARDLNGRIIYVNPAFCKMTGFSAEELVDHSPPMPYWAPEHLDEARAMHQTVLAGLAPEEGFELTFMRKDGERFEALVYEAKLIDGNGRHTGWMASVLDITERKRAEELARQQQEQLQFTARLVTLGEMASTLAHELNQPLAAIASYNTGCLNLLATENFSCAELRPALEKMATQAQRAGRIIRRVHDFVRRSEPKRAPCALSDIIDDCLAFIEPEARKRHIRIETTLPALPDISLDRLLIEQVLLNLLRNALDAMADTAPAHRQLHLDVALGTQDIRLHVTDYGCGIAPEIADKLYTAFFTTKSEGMGIGLSICRSIIEFHRGRLWAEDLPDSPSGSGTRFTFTLPLDSNAE